MNALVKQPTEPAFTSAELLHYKRQMILPELGQQGQAALKAARVLMVGAGGLGSPVGLYLAAAGIGTLGIVEFDDVDASNLHRQVLFGADQIGSPKLEAAVQRLQALNPHVSIVPHATRLDANNALEVLGNYDLVVDCTDNFGSRYLINDACVLLKKRLVHASIFRFEGMLSVFGDDAGPCYRCLYPEPPPAGLLPSCSEAGVLGVLPGIVGSLQANEVIKLVTGSGTPLVGRMLQFDALKTAFQEFVLERDPDCPACGTNSTMRTLADYDSVCAVDAGAPQFSIRSDELAARLDANEAIHLLDVREPSEFAIDRIDGARLLPLGELKSRIDELDEHGLIVCYCQSGMRSKQAVEILREAHRATAFSLEGGIAAWQKFRTA